MSDLPNDAALSRAVDAARSALTPEESAKLDRLVRDKSSMDRIASGISPKDWAQVSRILNDPDLLKKVLSSPRGKSALREFLRKTR